MREVHEGIVDLVNKYAHECHLGFGFRSSKFWFAESIACRISKQFDLASMVYFGCMDKRYRQHDLVFREESDMTTSRKAIFLLIQNLDLQLFNFLLILVAQTYFSINLCFAINP